MKARSVAYAIEIFFLPQDAVDSAARQSSQAARRAQVPNVDPLNTPLPRAPRMRLYCGYGHGIPTERAYHYRHASTLF